MAQLSRAVGEWRNRTLKEATIMFQHVKKAEEEDFGTRSSFRLKRESHGRPILTSLMTLIRLRDPSWMRRS